MAYDAGHLTSTTQVGDRKGNTVPVAWHGGNDFSITVGADTVELAFQPNAASQASALIWRGATTEYRLDRLARSGS